MQKLNLGSKVTFLPSSNVQFCLNCPLCSLRFLFLAGGVEPSVVFCCCSPSNYNLSQQMKSHLYPFLIYELFLIKIAICRIVCIVLMLHDWITV